MHFFHTVSSMTEKLALHDTRESATFASAGHIHTLDLGELLDSHLGSDLQVRLTAELADETLRLTTSLGNQLDTRCGIFLRTLAVKLRYMPSLAATRQTPRLILETQLDSLISIAIVSANRDMIRTGLIQ